MLLSMMTSGVIIDDQKKFKLLFQRGQPSVQLSKMTNIILDDQHFKNKYFKGSNQCVVILDDQNYLG